MNTRNMYVYIIILPSYSTYYRILPSMRMSESDHCDPWTAFVTSIIVSPRVT
jgi:hypothetical protein